MAVARVWLAENRDAILRTASQYGARHVRVFGSAARGKDRPDSDIDLWVAMEAMWEVVATGLDDLERSVRRLLS